MKGLLFTALTCVVVASVQAQPSRWQQRVHYQIDASLDVSKNLVNGQEKLTYWNNSPDTLNRIFIHLYWNAFQPNSMMDQRSIFLGKTLLGYDKNNKAVFDWDDRVRDRINNLKPDEIGFQKVQYVKIAGKEQQLVEHETILEVKLDKPLLPQSKTQFDIAFQAQVPLQVRRSGRDNAQGVRFSMSQWYPKIAEYDYQGWNANPYVAREFYGVWGDYEVNLTLNKEYLVAATGTLQNPDEVGHGYGKTTPASQSRSGNLTWRFSAPNVHDFVWAADPTYKLITRRPANGPLLYVVYKKDSIQEYNWQRMADTMQLAYPYMAKTFGPYPWKNYTFIQGGDGGMEYPMATLIKGPGVGTALHEWMHSWYQGLLATNESLYPWMDEGFTTYADTRVHSYLRKDSGFWYADAYDGYYRLVRSGREEPISTHADHYNTNYAYGNASYSKGCVFLAQLGYIVGEQTLDKILLEYYDQWKFKHPNPNDFIRIAEKLSNIELQWYKEYWVYTTKTIDYAVGDINLVNGKTELTIKKLGHMPMPIDVLVTYKDGSRELHYIPMNLMYGSKPATDAPAGAKWIEHGEWKWTQGEYQVVLDRNITEIKSVQIDPSLRLADVNRGNNSLVVPD
ncbi:M1 family metallopeptidase [Filimonas effusa]|uniref:M1 family peptidase n=1 Tax=Filimonas effusa TaxID=2508721 RepID=A0A4Q1DCV2_9BACT|nr:M1 family metallopeptidase [Filimonas effusa]RXK87364.1 M1 family peptidase [Filimonas effusa]